MKCCNNCYHASNILDLKQGWIGMKIAKMAKDHCCIPLCNNDKHYNSSEDLFSFNFPRDKKKQKRMSSL